MLSFGCLLDILLALIQASAAHRSPRYEMTDTALKVPHHLAVSTLVFLEKLFYVT